MSDIQLTKFNTDVLVIGGGIAGVFAAVNAAQAGAKVTMVDKGKIGFSGMSIWGDTFCVFDEREGHTRDDWHSIVSIKGEYVNNRDYLDMMLDDSAARWRDLNDWGAIGTDKFGKFFRKQVRAHHVIMSKRTMLTGYMGDETCQ